MFRKYNSIENSYRKSFIEEVNSQLTESTKTSDEFADVWKDVEKEQLVWCVTEKVHGANCSFITDGKDVIPAKRTSLLQTVDELKSFYNCEQMVRKVAPKIKDLFNILMVNDKPEIGFAPQINYIIVYGELFGGIYDGFVTSTPVQGSIKYSPTQNFIAFDIYIVRENVENYMNYHDACALFISADLLHAKILFEGELKDCLEWSALHNSDPTTIPDILGLQECKNNNREGHVIKPVENFFLKSGSRAILKDKNPSFAEKTDSHIFSYITKQRLESVKSKYGDISREELLKYYIQDVVEDYNKDFGIEYTVETQLRKRCEKMVN